MRRQPESSDGLGRRPGLGADEGRHGPAARVPRESAGDGRRREQREQALGLPRVEASRRPPSSRSSRPIVPAADDGEPQIGRTDVGPAGHASRLDDQERADRRAACRRTAGPAAARPRARRSRCARTSATTPRADVQVRQAAVGVAGSRTRVSAPTSPSPRPASSSGEQPRDGADTRPSPGRIARIARATVRAPSTPAPPTARHRDAPCSRMMPGARRAGPADSTGTRRMGDTRRARDPATTRKEQRTWRR